MNNYKDYAQNLIDKKVNYRKIIIKEPNYIQNLIKTTLDTEISNQKFKIRSIKKNILEQQKYLLEEDIKLKSLLNKQNDINFKDKKIQIIRETKNKTNRDNKTLNF